MLRLFLVSFKDVSLSADLLLSAPPTSSSSPLVEEDEVVKVIFCKVVMMMMLLGSLCSATEAIAAVMSPADFKMPPFHHDGGLILL